ncbi:NAD-dependent epimerase/dehydratase family protein [Lentzea sp. NPDC004789]|jgi:nucleoside-diphosphate-sugar epimerase
MNGNEWLGRYRKVAVTGGLGFVGGHLTSVLTGMGKEVIVLDVASGQEKRTGPTEVRCVDLRDGEATRDALHDADLVFHLAGNSSGTVSVDRPRFDFESNALTTFNVAEALAGRRTRLVYLSTAMVYGQPRSCPVPETHALAPFLPYGASKLSGEMLIRALTGTHGLSSVIARAFTVYGPGENPRLAGGEVSQYLRWHLNGLPIRVTGDLDRKTRDFVHVRDLVRGLVVAAGRGEQGEVYNIGSGREYSLRTLIDVIGRASGRTPVVDVRDEISEDSYRMVADTARLRALGYRPEIELPDGVRALAAQLGPNPELPEVDTIFRSDQRAEEEVPC